VLVSAAMVANLPLDRHGMVDRDMDNIPFVVATAGATFAALATVAISSRADPASAVNAVSLGVGLASLPLLGLLALQHQ